MAVARIAGEFGVELAADEPGMHRFRQLDHLAQAGARRAPSDDEALCFEFGQQGVVDFVAMAMPLDDARRAVDLARQRALGEFARLTAEAHGAAQIGLLAALLDLAGAIKPLGDEADD